MNYIATFHTHLAALRTHRALTGQGVRAQMAPVPRCLSSSCGVCVLYQSETPRQEAMDGDAEAIYREEDGAYRLVWRGEP